jgi:DNA-directed RNA polymerase subunit M/transcription elongation factor TFIIS
MKTMTHLEHHKKNGEIDWSSYRAAQKANGEICTKCGGYVSVFGGVGHPDECASCKSLGEPEEVTHADIIRCPACGHEMKVSDFDSGELYGDGEHDVTCDECDHEFEVSTSVSYSFQSPARLAPSK